MSSKKMLPRRCRDDFFQTYRDRAAAAMTFSKIYRDPAAMDISGIYIGQDLLTLF